MTEQSTETNSNPTVIDPLQLRVMPIAIAALKTLQPGKVWNTGDLVTEIISELSSEEQGRYSRNQIYQAIKELSSNPETAISSSRGRGGGYFLIAESKDTVSDSASASKQKPPDRTYEKHLWPVVADWVRHEWDITTVTAELADSKNNGKWGNPDLIALLVTDDLGLVDVEILTFEVKSSLNDWRHFIFEAVSHKRFANRSYFLFRTDAKFSKTDLKGLIEYGEKYGVGIVALDIDDDAYKALQGWERLEPGKRENILDSFDEILPARFDHISARDKVNYLRKIGVSSKADLFSFGLVSKVLRNKSARLGEKENNSKDKDKGTD